MGKNDQTASVMMFKLGLKTGSAVKERERERELEKKRK